MAPKPPHRTALIGLSSTATTSWASLAHLPGLLSPHGQTLLPITALLNSSVSAARAAITTYNLPPTTKAYGTPATLAADPSIDLVICNTRVDKHITTIIDSVRAGKDVFVEWPVASTLEDINVIVEAAGRSRSRVAVGLQRRWAPPVVKIREVLREGVGGRRLGRVLSADVRAFGGTKDREVLPEGLAYFAERRVGGNPIVIGFAHAFDWVLSVLGDLNPSTVHTKLQLQRPSTRIRDPQTNEITRETTSNVPDLLSLHGALLPSALTTASSTLSFLFRRGQPFPGTPALTFTINCEFGELRVTSFPGLSLETLPGEEPVKIEVHWFEDDKVEEVSWDDSEEEKNLPPVARSVWRTLRAFAEGKEEGDGWVGLKDAARRAEMIESFLVGWEKETKGA
ncbi:putative oxidoreductase [Lentithecium fluviatile CBS 122367]|uniref:Putative oxidoreductase n=1 Tax=Lentithecium fluviatile CBS 122367 TaxID=1168545 RepID=A0A6G1J7V1_9PLEO|nr:putative oxidoreductase [Lentithecium fluviatile CBS 122367]